MSRKMRNKPSKAKNRKTNTGGKSNGAGKTPEWVIVGELRYDSINMLMVMAVHLKTNRSWCVAAVPFTGNLHPNVFFDQVNTIIRVIHSTISQTHGGVLTGVDQNSFRDVCQQIVKAVGEKIKSAMVGPDGKKILKVEADGAILSVTPDDVKVEGMEKSGTLLEFPVESAEGSSQDDMAETDEDPGPVPPPNEGKTGRLIIPPGAE